MNINCVNFESVRWASGLQKPSTIKPNSLFHGLE